MAVAAAGSLIVAVTGGAQATTPDVSVQAEITQVLERTAGGVQISPNQIAWQDGRVVLTIPLAGEKPARAAEGSVAPLGTRNCTKYWTCLYEHKDYEGRKLSFTECNEIQDLSDYDFSDKTSSWHNNQSSGTKTRVYNWTGSWSGIWTTGGAESWSSYVGAADNDKADGIKAC
ncbi:peptidase inhibitor family I36 protein [Lentzea xinjiangensis]|uniref:peptidase inhibitor family I36 protein n=1 Tax=Lentzea xinjiangensis TaxID=402600 RepID=UPI0015A4F2CC|nr:peptidase inhibitor family I36 protein [Lentzea xinjiangensis]